MAGILGMVGVLFVTFRSRIQPRWFFITAAILVGMLGVRTAVRGTDWSSQYTLALHDIAASKQDYNAYNDIAYSLMQQHKFNEAEMYAERSIDIFPGMVNYNNLGFINANMGDFQGAVNAYYAGLKYSNYGYSSIYENIAALTPALGNPRVDQQFLLQAVGRFPHDSKIWMFLAILDDRYGDNPAAKVAISQAAKYGQVPQFVYEGIMNNQPFNINAGAAAKGYIIQ
jgi:tetratricopeptide (TPR) repeat protein